MAFDSIPEVNQRSRDLIVLERARERIARGWCQHTIAKGQSVCVLGALVLRDGGSRSPFEGDWDPLAALVGFERWQDAKHWNDAPGRTQAEVLARFDSAIAKLASQG